jgi:hypothetical protein
MIRKEGREYVLYTHNGSKILGRHKTKEEAVRQEQAIMIAKKQKGKKGTLLK